jgi:hypothetical protein
MEYKQLSKRQLSLCAPERVFHESRISCLSSSMHRSSLDYCESIWMDGGALPLPQALSVTASPLREERSYTTPQNTQQALEGGERLLIPALDSPSVQDNPSPGRRKDLLPKCLDVLPLYDGRPLASAHRKDCSLVTASLLGKRPRSKMFVLQPRAQPTLRHDITFIDVDTDTVPFKRPQLVSSFVSLDAEVHQDSKDATTETLNAWDVCSTADGKSPELPTSITIAWPVVFRPTIRIERLDDMKGQDKSRTVFQPSRRSAFTMSPAFGRKRLSGE